MTNNGIMSRPGALVQDTEKVSGELFSLTYFAFVVRIVEDRQSGGCQQTAGEGGIQHWGQDFKSICWSGPRREVYRLSVTEVKVQMGFKMSPSITSFSAASDEFSLAFESIPLADNYSHLKVF